MAANLEDLLQLIRIALLADPTISALVDGEHVRTEHVKDADMATAPMPVVIIEPTTGFGSYNRVVQAVTLHIWAYSRNGGGETVKLYDAIYSALQAACIGDPNVSGRYLMREVDRPVTGHNDKHDAHFYRGRWTASGVDT